MRLPSFVRGVVVLALIGVSGCSSGPDEIRTVADFDAAPCLLFTDEAMSGTVAEPYARLAGVEPKLTKTQAADVGEDTRACVYTFEAAGAPQVPQVGQMTVTVAHHKDGSQPLAICVGRGGPEGGRVQAAADRRPGLPVADLGPVDEGG